MWDIAGVFQSVINSWYFNNTELTEALPADQQHSLQVFWDKYCDLLELAEAERHLLLEKAIAYTAIRIIQTCLESTFKATSFYNKTARYLQLAHSMLRYPEEAKTELLGLHHHQGLCV